MSKLKGITAPVPKQEATYIQRLRREKTSHSTSWHGSKSPLSPPFPRKTPLNVKHPDVFTI
jgi:hypothetical protein